MKNTWGEEHNIFQNTVEKKETFQMTMWFNFYYIKIFIHIYSFAMSSLTVKQSQELVL